MKIFNKILSVLLIFFFFVITGQNTIAYLYFKINQNYIAKNICVQKDIKDNYCLGNCYLAAIEKRLNENQKENSTNTTPVKYNTDYLQEYIANYIYKFRKTESVLILNRKNTYQVLQKNYAPLTPPPKSINII